MAVYGVPSVGRDRHQEAVHHEYHHRGHVVQLEDGAVDTNLVKMEVLGDFTDLVMNVIVHDASFLFLSKKLNSRCCQVVDLMYDVLCTMYNAGLSGLLLLTH